MSGAANAIIGSEDLPTSLPQTQVDDEFLNQEKNLAKYSKSREFQELKAYLEARIQFFKTFLPDGKEVRWQTDAEMGVKWIVANNVINEFQAVLDRYELAKETVAKAERGER